MEFWGTLYSSASQRPPTDRFLFLKNIVLSILRLLSHTWMKEISRTEDVLTSRLSRKTPAVNSTDSFQK